MQKLLKVNNKYGTKFGDKLPNFEKHIRMWKHAI